jgi:Protein of unknown function (DUF4079)
MRIFVVLSLLSSTSGFITVQPHRAAGVASSTYHRIGLEGQIHDPLTPTSALFAFQGDEMDDEKSLVPNDNSVSDESSQARSMRLNSQALAAAVVTWMATAQTSLAAGPDWGIFEGRTGSLLHPIMMGSLLLYSIYTGLLGFQWRRQRTIGDEIKKLQKTLPDLKGASSVADAIKTAQSAEDASPSYISSLKAALPVEDQIKELQKERKSLVEAGPRDKHYSQGALLAFLGTAFAIEVRLSRDTRFALLSSS